MLLWNSWRWLRGYVTFRAEGGLCERFLTLLREADPPLETWNVRRTDCAVTVQCRAADYRRIRPFARRTGTRVYATRKRGLPFAVGPLQKRLGLLVGAAAAVVLYMVLASRIWIVDIDVDDPLLTARLEAQLASWGVASGKRANDVDVSTIRMKAIAENKEINQLSLYFDGSIARVGVQLQKDSAVVPDSTPANIIAAHDGRIISMQTTVGRQMVMVGEAVVKGDLLVCGAVETEKGTLLRRASAVVLAETEREFEERISLKELLPCEGRVVEQPSLRILGWRLPLYSRTIFDDRWTVTTAKRCLTLFGTTLPVGIESNVYTERTHVAVTHTKATAEQLAKKRLEARADTALSHAEIQGVSFEGVWQGDVYCLRAVYQCVEDIASQIPLILSP